MTARTSPENFWPRVRTDAPSECWEWPGARTQCGYGKASYLGRTIGAHRLAYIFAYGDIPAEHEVDHLCRNPLCCNPEHLEAVSPAENRRRQYEAKTHCKRGHELTTENVRYRPGERYYHRACRVCQRENQARYIATRKKKAAAAAEMSDAA